MVEPKASVVIPSYNHARFIAEAVRSVVDGIDTAAETPIEVVVVDDGSTDDSVQRLRAIDDPRLRLLTQDNAGAHAALNRAIEASRAPIVFILNSDDRFRPGRIERLLAIFDQQPEVALAGSWLQLIDGQGEAIGIKHGWRDLPPWPRPESGAGLAEIEDPELALLESNYLATTSNLAFRRSLFADHGMRFLPLRYAHDWQLMLEACRWGRLHIEPEPLVDYRVHGSNTIKEGAADGAADGRALMQLEILWLVARHAATTLRAASQRGIDLPVRDLGTRAWRSMPRFGCPGLLIQLLAARGDADEVPASFDQLIEPTSPWRRQALDSLRTAEDSS